MINLDKLPAAKIIAPVLVLGLAAAAMTGAVFAYNASFLDTTSPMAIAGSYGYIELDDSGQGSGKTTTLVPLKMVTETSTTYTEQDGNVTSMQNTKFVSLANPEVEISSYQMTYHVKYLDQDGNPCSDERVSGTLSALPLQQGRSAVESCSNAFGTTNSQGECDLTFTVTLISSSDIVSGVNYYIPSFNVVIQA